jgi:hypothetical protein
MAFYSLLLLQLFVYTWFAIEIPLQYDEWHSWHFFSDVSFKMIFTWYPAPNNHVFYNLVARCFVLTGIDAEVAVRLPSVIASLFTTYFFFRLFCRFFPSWLSFVAVAALITEYFFVYYNISARGYSFVYLFCVLLLTASAPLAQNYAGRNRLLFIFSQVLGLFTVLSFLYVMVVPGLILFIYVIRLRSRPALLRFLGDYAWVGILTVICYSGILFIGDPSVFFNPEAWTEKFDIHDANWFNNLVFYLDTKFFELFGIYRLKTAAIIVLLLVIYHLWKKDRPRPFMVLVCAAMFYFPFVIVLAHRVYPFGRSLNYLIIPSIFLLAAAVNDLRELIARFSKMHFPQWITTGLAFLSIFLCLAFYIDYPSRHRSGWDYEMDLMRRTRMKNMISHIHSIGKTNKGFEFYPHDLFIHYVYKERPEVPVVQSPLDSVINEDVVLIHHSELDSLRPHLKNYSFLFDYGSIRIFVADSFYKTHK